MELQDLTFAEGQNNTPGVYALMFCPFIDAYLIPDTQAPKPELAVDLESIQSVSTNIILKQNKKFINLYHTDMTGDFKFVLQGEQDSKNFKVTLKVSIPNKTKGASGFLTYVKNNRGFFLINTKAGDTILMGGPRFPVRLESVDGGFGENATGASAAVVTFWVDDPVAIRYFTGKVMIGSATGGGSGVGATEQVLFAN